LKRRFCGIVQLSRKIPDQGKRVISSNEVALRFFDDFNAGI
jgi:hypothetical protein